VNAIEFRIFREEHYNLMVNLVKKIEIKDEYCTILWMAQCISWVGMKVTNREDREDIVEKGHGG
jgi:hypothetical protein